MSLRGNKNRSTASTYYADHEFMFCNLLTVADCTSVVYIFVVLGVASRQSSFTVFAFTFLSFRLLGI